MADIELKTYGDLKNAINNISLRQKGDKIVSQGKSFALDQVLGLFPGASNAKTLYDFIKSATSRPDAKKSKTWLDKLDIDDDVSAIVDDTIENGFLKYMSNKIKSRNDNDDLEDDFDMNQELTNYLSDKYNQRYVAGVPNVNEMDKKTKVKEILKAKLKQEMSVTGTGASVTPGVGMGVATKYAFKKKVKEDAPQLAAGKVKDNYAVSHFGFKNAPSVPNRKSKAMDYKELWENFKVGDKVKYENQEWEIISFLDNGTVRLKNLKGLPSTNVIPSNIEKLQEGYAQFRKSTKQRSKPDQFHEAVKQVKQKMNEINRIFEYVDRLKSELSEGEDLKYKKYTENAFSQIKESAKQLFLKSTKLK
jgi:hypothetical protein